MQFPEWKVYSAANGLFSALDEDRVRKEKKEDRELWRTEAQLRLENAEAQKKQNALIWAEQARIRAGQAKTRELFSGIGNGVMPSDQDLADYAARGEDLARLEPFYNMHSARVGQDNFDAAKANWLSAGQAQKDMPVPGHPSAAGRTIQSLGNEAEQKAMDVQTAAKDFNNVVQTGGDNPWADATQALFAKSQEYEFGSHNPEHDLTRRNPATGQVDVVLKGQPAQDDDSDTFFKTKFARTIPFGKGGKIEMSSGAGGKMNFNITGEGNVGELLFSNAGEISAAISEAGHKNITSSDVSTTAQKSHSRGLKLWGFRDKYNELADNPDPDTGKVDAKQLEALNGFLTSVTKEGGFGNNVDGKLVELLNTEFGTAYERWDAWWDAFWSGEKKPEQVRRVADVLDTVGGILAKSAERQLGVAARGQSHFTHSNATINGRPITADEAESLHQGLLHRRLYGNGKKSGGGGDDGDKKDDGYGHYDDGVVDKAVPDASGGIMGALRSNDFMDLSEQQDNLTEEQKAQTAKWMYDYLPGNKRFTDLVSLKKADKDASAKGINEIMTFAAPHQDDMLAYVELVASYNPNAAALMDKVAFDNYESAEKRGDNLGKNPKGDEDEFVNMRSEITAEGHRVILRYKTDKNEYGELTIPIGENKGRGKRVASIKYFDKDGREIENVPAEQTRMPY